MKIAVFASGNGSNFQTLAEQFPDQVKFVFSDHHDAYVLERAERLGVAKASLELKEFSSKVDYEKALVEILKDQEIDLILLAGYMKIIGATVLSKYKGKIINVHPSYLPDFAGSPHAIEESHEVKKGLGISIHYVDEGVDTGELIAQISLAYHEDLEVYERSVHEAEHKLYPEVVRQIILHQQ